MYKYQTKSKSILGDMHTPVSAYMRLRDIGIQSALMESNDYHGTENSRSFIGISPVASFAIEHGEAVLRMPDETIVRKPITANYRVENALSEFLANFEISGDNSKYCGLYGYTSFNSVRYFEDIPVEDSYVATRYAIGLDGLLYFYERNKEVNEIAMRDAFIEQLRAVVAHTVNDDRTSTIETMSQICLPIIVPEGARVFPFRDGLHQM